MEDEDLQGKAGTLNFVSSLSGYLTYKGKSLGFAILTADLAQREKVKGRENPPGVKGWEARSRSLQYALLREWLGHLRQGTEPCARACLNGGAMQAINLKLMAYFLQHAQLDLPQFSIRRGHIAGHSIGGFVQSIWQSVPD